MNDERRVVTFKRTFGGIGGGEFEQSAFLLAEDDESITVTSAYMRGEPVSPKRLLRSELEGFAFVRGGPEFDLPRRMDGGMNEAMVRAGVRVLEKHVLTEGFYEQNLRSLAIDLYSQMFLRRPVAEWPKGKLDEVRARVAAVQDEGKDPSEVLGEEG